MKKLIIFALFISTCTFSQSITILPSPASNPAIEIQKSGRGINHSSSDNLIGIGTYVDNAAAWIQTHTNHPLRFRTNGGDTQMILATNGNVGIGNNTPTQKLHVDGNATVTGSTDSDGLVTGGSLTIGGGNTISKISKVYLTGQAIPGLSGNFCGSISYNIAGVSSDDTVILNIESTYSTLHVASVIPQENMVQVKYCNVSNSPSSVTTGNMRFTIIK